VFVVDSYNRRVQVFQYFAQRSGADGQVGSGQMGSGQLGR
jgi:hypothetical protein